jgi:SAM-dependent methyltransferase
MTRGKGRRPVDSPWLYRLSQVILAPGAESSLTRTIRDLCRQLTPTGTILDVGCGPSSWLFRVGLDPVGLDLSFAYSAAYAGPGHRAVVGSADVLPFASHSFEGVWSIGLLHHLPDATATRALREMIRVCGPGGHVVVFDSVMPRSAWRRPLAYLIRRLDRGRFVRRESDLTSLLLSVAPFRIKRMTYSHLGLELLACWSTRPLSLDIEARANVAAHTGSGGPDGQWGIGAGAAAARTGK